MVYEVKLVLWFWRWSCCSGLGGEVVGSSLWVEVVGSSLGGEIVGRGFGGEIVGGGLGGEAIGGSGFEINVRGGFAETCLGTFDFKLYFNSLKLLIVLYMFKANLAFPSPARCMWLA